MAHIELKVSDQALALWKAFLQTEPAGRLSEAGLLGDWTVLGFIGEVNRYIEQGAPRPHATVQHKMDAEASQARRKLSKPQKRVLPMFDENDVVTVGEISRMLGLVGEKGAELVSGWLSEGFLAPGPDRDGEPTFHLGERWRQLNLTANRPSLFAPRAPMIAGKLPDE